MDKSEALDKAKARLQADLDGMTRELSDLIRSKISLVDSIDSIAFRALNKLNDNAINEYQELIFKKDEAEIQLAVLLDEISILGIAVNAMMIGIKQIEDGAVSDLINDVQSEAYSNKVSDKLKSVFRR